MIEGVADTVSSTGTFGSVGSVISTASKVSGEVAKHTVSTVMWIVLLAMAMVIFLAIPGTSPQECLWVASLGCQKALAWITLRLVVTACVAVGSYYGLSSALTPVLDLTETTVSTALPTMATNEPSPYLFHKDKREVTERVKRGILEDIASVDHVPVASLAPMTDVTEASTISLSNSSSAPDSSAEIIDSPELDSFLNISSPSTTMAGVTEFADMHNLTTPHLNSPYEVSDIDLKLLQAGTWAPYLLGLGSSAVILVLIVAVGCVIHRTSIQRLRRRIGRLQAGLDPGTLGPYAAKMEEPIQQLARLQAELAAAGEFNTSAAPEVNTTPPTPPSSPTLAVRFNMDMVPHVVTKKVGTLADLSTWSDVPLDEDTPTGMTNPYFNLYENLQLRENVYDTPEAVRPVLPPKATQGFLGRALARATSFSRPRPASASDLV